MLLPDIQCIYFNFSSQNPLTYVILMSEIHEKTGKVVCPNMHLRKSVSVCAAAAKLRHYIHCKCTSQYLHLEWHLSTALFTGRTQLGPVNFGRLT